MTPHDATAGPSGASAESAGPARPAAVLGTLILVAAIANLPLAVANVALPSIGLAFDASQTQLNLVAVGYSLGLAASVLWLGAIGDRYGRKSMLLFGVLLSLPACLVAAWAPSIEVLIGARVVGGLAAGMAYPTTLALITALWGTGPGRTRSIALWSAIGGAVSALGPLIAGLLLRRLGAIFVGTGAADPHGAEGAGLQAVRAGERLVVFPEGRLRRMPGLLSFYPGPFLVAAQASAPVIPVALSGTRSILRHSHQWFPRHGSIIVHIGAPIQPEGDDFASALKAGEAARAEILAHCMEPDLGREEIGFGLKPEE